MANGIPQGLSTTRLPKQRHLRVPGSPISGPAKAALTTKMANWSTLALGSMISDMVKACSTATQGLRSTRVNLRTITGLGMVKVSIRINWSTKVPGVAIGKKARGSCTGKAWIKNTRADSRMIKKMGTEFFMRIISKNTRVASNLMASVGTVWPISITG
jgi:hypothetical protein